MRILKRLIVAKWYVKLVAVFAGLLLIPVILMSFLFTTSYLRWGREKQDLLSNVRKYHQYIIDAERRKKKIKISQSKPTRIFDRYNRLIGEFMTEKKEVVPFKDIKKLLVRAILAMEDTEFYVHNGVNIQRTARAVINNLIGRSRGGGSTITQQLAKILFTNRERTIHRKIFEFFGAKELESRYSKNDILLMYLNTVYFGNGAWGVEAASRLYFNKSVRILDVYECALLAGLLSRPESYSPLNDKDAAKRKHIQALSRMVKLGYAKASVLGSGFERFWEELEKKLSSPNVSFWKMRVNKAPYFIEFIRQRLKRYFKEDEIIRGGLRVYTTIDASMQKIARKAVQRGLARVELAKQKDIKEWLFKNRKRISRMIKKATPDEKQQILAIWDQKRASYLNEHSKPIEGALVSIDSSNGYILAMIGGRNYTFDNELNRAINSSRQFGSAMKPIVYTSAIENKVVTAATVINDKRRKYDDHGKVWSPKNYDRQYFGNVSIRKALILSINTVAVETIYRLGARKVAASLEKIFYHKRGFPPILSLPLGSVAISPLDGARIYSTLASGGYRVKPLFIRRIINKKGVILYDFETSKRTIKPISQSPDNTQKLPDTLKFADELSKKDSSTTSLVFDPRAVYIVTDMMRDVFSPKGTGYYARLVNQFHINAAGKSGTSDNGRDAWFAGFVKNVAAVVWVGYDNDKTPLPKNQTGGVSAGPIWTEFMKNTFWDIGNYNFKRPAGVVDKTLCRQTSLINNSNCTNTYTEYFIDGTEITDTCTSNHGFQSLQTNTLISTNKTVNNIKTTNTKTTN